MKIWTLSTSIYVVNDTLGEIQLWIQGLPLIATVFFLPLPVKAICFLYNSFFDKNVAMVV